MASINIYLVYLLSLVWGFVYFGEKYTRKECFVSLSAGLAYQRSPSANLTGPTERECCYAVAELLMYSHKNAVLYLLGGAESRSVNRPMSASPSEEAHLLCH